MQWNTWQAVDTSAVHLKLHAVLSPKLLKEIPNLILSGVRIETIHLTNQMTQEAPQQHFPRLQAVEFINVVRWQRHGGPRQATTRVNIRRIRKSHVYQQKGWNVQQTENMFGVTSTVVV